MSLRKRIEDLEKKFEFLEFKLNNPKGYKLYSRMSMVNKVCRIERAYINYVYGDELKLVYLRDYCIKHWDNKCIFINVVEDLEDKYIVKITISEHIDYFMVEKSSGKVTDISSIYAEKKEEVEIKEEKYNVH